MGTDEAEGGGTAPGMVLSDAEIDAAWTAMTAVLPRGATRLDRSEFERAFRATVVGLLAPSGIIQPESQAMGDPPQPPLEASAFPKDALLVLPTGPEAASTADALRQSARELTIEEIGSLGHLALDAIDQAAADPDGRERADRLRALTCVAIGSARATVARSMLDQAVLEARSEGVPWTQIAKAAGMTPAAAQRRWDPEARRKHNDYQRNRKSADRADSEV